MPRKACPSTVQCKPCAVSKATRVNSREPVVLSSPQPFYEMGVDLFKQEKSFSGYTIMALLTCSSTGLSFGKCFASRAQNLILQWLLEIFARCRNKYLCPVATLRGDNELLAEHTTLSMSLRSHGNELRLTDPHTSSKNGGAERCGRTIFTKSRTMLEQAHLPTNLWSESAATAVFLYNRTSAPQLSPYEKLHLWLIDNVSLYASLSPAQLIPEIGHLKAYGCRVPHAHVGYIVGYVSSPQYRIWVTEVNKVIVSSHVTFNETLFMGPSFIPSPSASQCSSAPRYASYVSMNPCPIYNHGFTEPPATTPKLVTETLKVSPFERCLKV